MESIPETLEMSLGNFVFLEAGSWYKCKLKELCITEISTWEEVIDWMNWVYSESWFSFDWCHNDKIIDFLNDLRLIFE